MTWINRREAASIIGVCVNTFSNHAASQYYGLARHFPYRNRQGRYLFNLEQIQEVAATMKTAEVSLVAAIKVVARASNGHKIILTMPQPTIDIDNYKNIQAKRVEEIKFMLPVKPAKGYHSRQYQHIDELIGICEHLLSK